MVHARRVIVGSMVMAGLLSALPANAQDRTFYLDRIQIGGAPDDGLTVWRPYMHEETRLYGSLALGYSQNPLRDETVTDNRDIQRDVGNPMANQLMVYLMAGAEIANHVGVNVAVPIGLYMNGEDPAEESNIPNAPNADTAPQALHDTRLDLRIPLLRQEKTSWGIGGSMWFPTGYEDSFAGDDITTGMVFTNLEFAFERFFITGMVGPHFRPERGLNNSPLQIASDLRWAVGGFVPFMDGRLRAGVELWGTTGIQNSNGEDAFLEGRNTDLEWLAQGRYALDAKKRRAWLNGGLGTRIISGYGAPDLRVLLQIGYWFPIKDKEPPSPARRWRAAPDVEDTESDRDGDGYPDNIDKCPDIKEDGAEPEPTDGCPAGADRDGDGIPDEVDRCPDTPEDKDGIEDEDGCPEKDADNDNIPDAEDKCPTEPGPASEIAEKHGCPGLARIDEASGEIAILEPIQFEYNSAQIKPVSFPILDEVVGLLKARGNLRIGVYGHTDSRGNDNYNLNLSKRRAASVMRYLAEHGIAQNRLESEGYGESRPKCNEETEPCWAINRRVEFKMLNQD
ncbi:MAG: OmpA family protein [Polyangiaceae bacterium]|nr:OmpA family protein [Polyangiaceae bacterium]